MDRSPNRRPLTLRQFLTEVAGLVIAAGAPAPEVGKAAFAKTMMFTGGSPEVQNLVNQAMAARAEANGNGAPDRDGNTLPLARVAAEQGDPNATPPPTGRSSEPPRRPHGAAVAATMVSMPAASGPRFGAGPVAGRQPAERGGKRDGQRHAADAAAGGIAARRWCAEQDGRGRRVPRDALVQAGGRRPDGGRRARQAGGEQGQGHACARARAAAHRIRREAAGRALRRRRIRLGRGPQEVLAAPGRNQRGTADGGRQDPGRADERRRSDGRDWRRQALRDHRRGGRGRGRRHCGRRRRLPRQEGRRERRRADPGHRAGTTRRTDAAAGRARGAAAPAPVAPAAAAPAATDDDQAPSAPKPHSSSSGGSHKHAAAAAAKKTKSKHHH